MNDKDILSILKRDLYWIINICVLIALFALLYNAYRKDVQLKERLEEIEIINQDNSYRKIYYEKEIESLSKTNKTLYDSIKGYKDQVSYLIQFKYEKEYDTGKVETKPKTEGKKDSTTIDNTIREYTYQNETNDTMNYTLTVASNNEPEWYRLRFKLSDQFTIINKDNGDINDITIGGNGQGQISDVTVFTRKNKESFFDRFAIGPSISYSYNINDKTFSPTIGFSITYNLRKNKK